MNTTPDVDESSGLVTRPPARPYPVGPSSVAEVLDSVVSTDPTRIALIDGDRTWTYEELDGAVDRWAAVLGDAGLESGRRLLWSTPNAAELVLAFLATQRIGAVWVALDPALTDGDRSAVSERVEPTVSVTDLAAAQTIAAAAAEAERVARSVVDPFAPAAIAFTSGTTGSPKAVVHTQHGLLGPSAASLELDPPSDGERIATPLSLCILNLLVLGPLSALARQSTAIVIGRRWAHALADDIRAQKITKLFLVPALLHDLVTDLPAADTRLSTLESVVVGGSGASATTRQEFLDRFGIRPIMSYGLTEAPTGVVRELPAGRAGTSTNAPLPHVDVRIIDGEICLAPTSGGRWAETFAPTVGYWRDPQRTRELFAGGVLHTGDTGRIVEDGSLRVTGRISEMIIRGGANIDPTEVERVLCEHDEVSAAIVVGVDDERLGQTVAAIVESSTLRHDQLLGYCHARLARHKMPERLIVVERLERNTMGKPDRAAARALLDRHG